MRSNNFIAVLVFIRDVWHIAMGFSSAYSMELVLGISIFRGEHPKSTATEQPLASLCTWGESAAGLWINLFGCPLSAENCRRVGKGLVYRLNRPRLLPHKLTFRRGVCGCIRGVQTKTQASLCLKYGRPPFSTL